jgi:hypothetical protein
MIWNSQSLYFKNYSSLNQDYKHFILSRLEKRMVGSIKIGWDTNSMITD